MISRAAAGAMPRKRVANWPRTVGIALVVLVALAIGLLHVIPLNGYIPGAAQTMSRRLGVPVDIQNLRYALLPSPRLTLERVAVGKLQEVKIGSIVVHAGPFALLSDTKDVDAVDIIGLTADQDALGLVPAWVRVAPGSQSLRVHKLHFQQTTLELREFVAPIFEGDVTVGPDGAVQRALFSGGGVRAELTQKDQVWRAAIDARNWKPWVGPALTFDELNVVAVFGPAQANLTSIEAKAGRGTMKGTAKVSWATDIRVDGEFNVNEGDIGHLMAGFTHDFSMSGTVTANGNIALQGKSLRTLFAEPRIEATFQVERGELNNVDIVRAVQSPSRDGVRGGKTRFETLTGTLQASNGQFALRKLQLGSGPMNATGSVDIAPNGDLSGRVGAELGSKTVVVARGTLNVTGNLRSPVLKP